MSHRKPLDDRFPIEQQRAEEATPVALISLFTLDATHEARFLEVRKDDTEFTKRQPGLISTRPYRSPGEDLANLNYAVWGPDDALCVAFTQPDFCSETPTNPWSESAGLHPFDKVGVVEILTT